MHLKGQTFQACGLVPMPKKTTVDRQEIPRILGRQIPL